jgi:hypothetical protein
MSSPGIKTARCRLLLISNDSAVVEQVAEGMRALGITTEVCGEVGMVVPLLSRQKFEAVMVDVEVGQAGQILEELRLSASNRTAVTFAITDPQKHAPLTTQPNFVMEKPLFPSAVARTLKAAFGLIVRERRRSFRCPTMLPAVVLSDGRESNCHVINISEGGMAIAQSPALKHGGKVRVLFSLPGRQVRFTVESEVCWYDETGLAGLRSLAIPAGQKSVLQEWLAAKLEEDLPESVASQFRKD